MMKRLVLGGVVGAGIGVVALFIAVAATGAGHGTLIPAAVLFPLPMLVASSPADMRVLAVVLAIVQYPLYGVTVAGTKIGYVHWFALVGLHSLLAVLSILHHLSVQR